MSRLAQSLILCLISLIVSLAILELAVATPKGYQEALREAKRLQRTLKYFKSTLKKLKNSDKAKVKNKFRGQDSDNDGIADAIELALGTELCATDSDGDGIDDGYDDHENDHDNNNDGQPDGEDGQEFEVKGEVESFTDPLLIVRGREFTLTRRTEFRGRGFNREDLQSGLCVEVAGKIEGELSLVDLVKLDDDC